MEILDQEHLKYPIGKFTPPSHYSDELLRDCVGIICDFPALLEQEVRELTEDELHWRYRTGGWSIRQVVHHCSDSHMNALIRLKLALTEPLPVIKPYLEDKWADLADSKTAPVFVAIELLKSLHLKWAFLIKSLQPEDFKKEFFHPEHNSRFSIAFNLANYSWHCQHHLEHVKLAKKLKIY
jgi:hypothetical protein